MLGLIVLLQALGVAVSGPATSPEYLPLHLAAAEGYFAREGLAVRLRTTLAESDAAEALARGDVHLAATTLDAVLRFGPREAERGPRLVFGLSTAPPCAVVAGAPHAADVRALGDLAGRRVGVARPGAPEVPWLGWLLTLAEVRSAHVDVVSLGRRGLVLALEAGEIDGAVVCEPSASAVLADRRATVLADLRTPSAVTRSVGALGVNAAVFARADRMPGMAELSGFARALLAATARLSTADVSALAGRLPEPVVGPRAGFEARLAASRHLLVPDGLVESEQVAQTIRITVAHRPLPAALRIPSPDVLVHLEPLRSALRDRGSR